MEEKKHTLGEYYRHGDAKISTVLAAWLGSFLLLWGFKAPSGADGEAPRVHTQYSHFVVQQSPSPELALPPGYDKMFTPHPEMHVRILAFQPLLSGVQMSV